MEMITPLRSIAPKLPEGFLYGGDYNPEQWPEEIWAEDARLMKEAGVNFVSVAIFSWAKLEPKPGQFDFAWLKRVIDLLWAHGVSVCLANATASPPAWLSRAHPESLPVDVNGVRLSIGSRQHYCPNSRAYRSAAANLSRKLTETFSKHPAVALWHINNEIGCHSNECFCDVCAGDFREWLRARYGSLETLNESWGTAFWSQAYGDWNEILPPRKTLTFRNPGQVQDYARFMNDSLRGILLSEAEAIRSADPEAKVTTNGLTFWKATNYWEWYPDMDIAAWDAYPDPALGLAEVKATAFCHDLFRSMKGGLPFVLMEQTASQVNWRRINLLKAPGQMRAISWQAVAHGADGVMFFQWRASRAGAEKFHGAMLPHYGPDGRVHREIRELGAELKKAQEICGARHRSRIALLVSWESRWAVEIESKPINFDYVEVVQHHYGALWNLNVSVDLAHPSADLSGYDVVVAPLLYQLSDEQAASLRAFVARGGKLIMSYFSGVADLRDHIGLGGYPAKLTDVLGMKVEEWQPLLDGQSNTLGFADHSVKTARGSKLCELINLQGAKAVATYQESWYAGRPAITRNKYGQGEAIYLGTHLDEASLTSLLSQTLQSVGLLPTLQASEGVEVTLRHGASANYLFVINHTANPATVTLGKWSGPDLLSGQSMEGTQSLQPFAVHILRLT